MEILNNALDIWNEGVFWEKKFVIIKSYLLWKFLR